MLVYLDYQFGLSPPHYPVPAKTNGRMNNCLAFFRDYDGYWSRGNYLKHIADPQFQMDWLVCFQDALWR